MTPALIELRLYTATGDVTTLGADPWKLSLALLAVLVLGWVLWEVRDAKRHEKTGES
ncbi:MAG: hypothetical protein K2Y26_00110 [Gemmatimonadaceae bacterium]|nr:hypothetical protein [Gemmatimonadaceae bacterium]